jgi:nitrite reductase (NADH) large subunit
MAVGIRPNVELAKSAVCYCDRGIVVNDTLQTFDPRIYAIGECVAHRGQVTDSSRRSSKWQRCAPTICRLWDRSLRGSQVSTKLKVTGVDLFLGRRFHRVARHRGDRASDPWQGVYKKLVLRMIASRQRALWRYRRRRVVLQAPA